MLFVCTANICRSPTAEAVFRARIQQAGLQNRIFTSSAGTIGKYRDEEADAGARKTAQKKGYYLDQHCAKKISPADFIAYDYIVAVDNYNLLELEGICPPQLQRKLHLLLDFAPGLEGRDVPDPYKRSGKHYKLALELIEAGTEGLLKHVRKQL